LTAEYEDINFFDSSFTIHWFFDQWVGKKVFAERIGKRCWLRNSVGIIYHQPIGLF
jgi:hypothetical protein